MSPDFSTFRLGSGADSVYESLISAHQGLSEADSARLNARLVLILLNALGDENAAQHVIAAARQNLQNLDNKPA
ncbi:MAG: DUF2783 domain-containing protein [Rhodobiaceae bacterium]|nr:DUF2783 domain-containing protein [Rhodobiaceae bacterium]MCC0015661.1 DUF2783 domain-containing protein [Rhodobiaceae bacterium]